MRFAAIPCLARLGRALCLGDSSYRPVAQWLRGNDTCRRRRSIVNFTLSHTARAMRRARYQFLKFRFVSHDDGRLRTAHSKAVSNKAH